jgi:hypothetical protein
LHSYERKTAAVFAKRGFDIEFVIRELLSGDEKEGDALVHLSHHMCESDVSGQF